MSRSPSQIQFGHSSKLIYDQNAYADKLSESVAPVAYKLNPNQIASCSACLSTQGPRSSLGAHSFGVSAASLQNPAPLLQLVDVDSILSSRNVLQSKTKSGRVNPIDVSKFKLQHPRICNSFLDPLATHLTNPPQNYRGMSINRFYNLHKPAQANIFYDFAINTKLEAIDNYRERIPRIIKYDPTLPAELRDPKNNPFGYTSCPRTTSY